MAVVRPSIDDVKNLAESIGLHFSDAETKVISRLLSDSLAAYDLVDELSDNLPEIDYPRTSGSRPGDHENRLNAWAWRVHIKGRDGGKLSGKTIAIKDCISVAGVPMSIGTEFLKDYSAEIDATVVTRTLDAGGEILGKATCEYLCMSGNSNTSWPAPVLNPWNPEYSAGGSSSGAAALVATGEVDMALGTDQGGSVRIPAAWCGIVGMKPTYGLVPYTGIAPIELTVDHVGPMTSNVYDNALFLEAIAGSDGLDPRQRMTSPASYTDNISSGTKGLRIGVVAEGFATPESEQDVDDQVRQAAENLRGTGAELEEISIPVHEIARAIWTPTILEGWVDLVMRSGGGGTNHGGVFVGSAIEAAAGWRRNPDQLSVPAKVVFMLGELMLRNYGGRFYGKSQNLIRKMRAEYDEILEKYDLLLMPTTPQKPTRFPDASASLEERWNLSLNMNRNTAPFCATGHPALTLPCGTNDGLPIGLMLIGRHSEEALIYQAAHALEQSIDFGRQLAHVNPQVALVADP